MSVLWSLESSLRQGKASRSVLSVGERVGDWCESAIAAWTVVAAPIAR